MSAKKLKENLAQTIRHYNSMGWSPATSTNYSFKDGNHQIWISRSGIDKSNFDSNDFIPITEDGKPIANSSSGLPSAETLIHCVLYDLFPNTKVILHSHSIFPVMISTLYQNEFIIQGYEIQKGLTGQQTHEVEISIPIFENSQNMAVLCDEIKEKVNSIQHHTLIIRKHGTYAWGRNLEEAKKHIETLEYLCHCDWLNKSIKT